MDISKKDWKLFRERLSGWQEKMCIRDRIYRDNLKFLLIDALRGVTHMNRMPK